MVVLRLFPLAAAGLFGLLPTTSTPCQVPDGWFVTSHAYFPSFQGSGGLLLHHPRRPGPPIPITGLPLALTGAGSAGMSGANWVTLLPDGRLLVGTLIGPGGAVELHVVTLLGTAYDPNASYSIPLGTATSPLGGVSEIQLLSATEALLFIDGIVTGPLAGQRLAIVDFTVAPPAPPALMPIPVSGMSSNRLLIAGASDGVMAYFSVFLPGTSNSQLYRVPLGGGAATLLTTWAGLLATAVEVEPTGALLVACASVPTGPGLIRLVDPVTGAVLRSTQVTPVSLNAFARETTTGGFAFAEGNQNGLRLYWGDGTGPATLLGSTRGWGGMTGVDVAPDPVAYGDPSPSWGNGPRWQLAPNPGGLPLAGNLTFAVGIDRPMDGIWVANLASANLPNWNGLGFDLLVSPNGGATIGVLSAGIANLPLPASVPLGSQLFLQSFHFTYAGPVASEGLRITTL